MSLYPRTDAIRTARLQRGTDKMPCLGLAYSLAPIRSNSREKSTSQNNGMTVTISATGGGGSKLRITLTQRWKDQNGTAGTPTTYIFDGATGGSGTVTKVCSTLYDLIKYINENVPNCTAWAEHAPHFLSLDSAAFEALAATEISTGRIKTKCLYRTPASGTTGYMRVGIPEVRDNGHMRVTSLRGTCTGVTAGTVKIYRDAYSQNLSSSTVEPVLQKTLTAAETEYVNKDKTDAFDYEGPVIVEVAASDLTAYDYILGYMQGDI